VIWIGVDAHKRLHQALALSDQGEVLGERTIANDPQAWAGLLEWSRGLGPERIWAVEGAWYLGRGLAQHLARSGERVHEVSGRWTARRRRGMRRPGKSDRRDARAVVQLLREEADSLPRVYAEEDPIATVQLWSRRQAELTEDMTRLMNRLHTLLLFCDPEYQAKLPKLTAKAGIAALRAYVAPGAGELVRERERAVRQLAEQLTLLAEQDRELRRKLKRASEARFSPLTQIEGVGPIIACAIVAEVGRPRPGFGEARFAALGGVAPLEASSRRGPPSPESSGQPPIEHGAAPDRAHAGTHLSTCPGIPRSSSWPRSLRPRSAARAQAARRSSRLPRAPTVLRINRRGGRRMTALT